MAQVPSRRLLGTLGTLQLAILALVVIAALVHLQRGISLSMFMFGDGPRGGSPPGGGAGRSPGGPRGGFNMFQYLPLPLPILFLINGIGYLLLGTALYLPALSQYRRIVRWLLIIFAATTFVLYFLLNGFRLTPIAVIDKVAELTLIVLLLVDSRQSSNQSAVEAVTT